MKTLIFLFFFLFFTSSLKAQKRKLNNNKEELCNVICSVFSNKESDFKLFETPLPFKSNRFDLEKALNYKFLNDNSYTLNSKNSTIKFDSVLSISDINYMKHQMKSVKIKRWNVCGFSKCSIKIISKSEEKTLESDLKKLYKKPRRYFFTIPVFSVDKNLCIIYEENYKGINDGGGQLNFYKKDKAGNWEFLAAVLIFVS